MLLGQSYEIKTGTKFSYEIGLLPWEVEVLSLSPLHPDWLLPMGLKAIVTPGKIDVAGLVDTRGSVSDSFKFKHEAGQQVIIEVTYTDTCAISSDEPRPTSCELGQFIAWLESQDARLVNGETIESESQPVEIG